VRVLVLLSCLAVLGATLVAVPVLVAEEEKPRLAVLNWAATDATPAQAEGIAEEMRSGFTRSGRYTVVDRTLTAKILEEWERQQSGLNEAERAIQVGKLYNVRYIVTGKVIAYEGKAWLVSAVMLDAQTGVAWHSQTLRHEGRFFDLLGQVPTLAARLAGVDAAASRSTGAASVPSAAPGATWTEPITGMEFVYVPGGSYEQGCGSWTSDCWDNEKPTRQVRLSPFWLGKTEVTQGQWKRVMGSNPSHFQKGDDYPVERVSWNDAQEFIKRLNAKSGQTYRLPSEAQWEYACRSGGKPVAFGTDSGSLNERNANYGKTSGVTTPVGKYPPNALGHSDMAGNVWEWTQDVYDGEAYRSGPASDPVNGGSGAFRVRRGGSWFNDPRLLRCSNRSVGAPSVSDYRLGFRLARTP